MAEFFHATQIPIIAVAVDPNRDVEFDLIVCVVGLRFTDVPGYTAAAQHYAAKGVVERFGCGDDADVFCATYPDAVVCEKLFGFVYAVAKLGRPLVDVVQQAEGQVLGYAAGADVGCVEAGAGDALVEFLYLG